MFGGPSKTGRGMLRGRGASRGKGKSATVGEASRGRGRGWSNRGENCDLEKFRNYF